MYSDLVLLVFGNIHPYRKISGCIGYADGQLDMKPEYIVDTAVLANQAGFHAAHRACAQCRYFLVIFRLADTQKQFGKIPSQRVFQTADF